MSDEKINVAKYWFKGETKKWLAENTDFKYPKTISPYLGFQDILNWIKDIPQGNWVLKPDVGRKSEGVVLFSRAGNQYSICSQDGWKSHADFKKYIEALATLPKWRYVLTKNNDWFVEEWVKPHPFYERFTDSPKVPPMLRFCGRPVINFIGLSPIDKEITGHSVAGWRDRKYIWLDLTGKVRNGADLDTTGMDKITVKTLATKNYLKAPYGEVFPHIPDVIKRINEQIVPKIMLFKNRTWCLDGIFNEDDEFIAVELNHSPGTQFIGFKW